uniref:Uncharacterized protein n=1 Tax=Arundo donax TaxID=35708 RepID=A0A0A9ES75_ARUDO
MQKLWLESRLFS